MNKVFICFSAKDRYEIAQPLAYNLKNYGVDIWYDRDQLVMGDNREYKNLTEGVDLCRYAAIAISKNTASSRCAMEEISHIKNNYLAGKTTVFPILYEISPDDIPIELIWVKDIIFKEVKKNTGTLELCNHIACKITEDYLSDCAYKTVSDLILKPPAFLSPSAFSIIKDYIHIDNENVNSRVSLLYSFYTCIKTSDGYSVDTRIKTMVDKIFERFFTETKLDLKVDYRDLRLLENAACLLVNIITDPGHFLKCE